MFGKRFLLAAATILVSAAVSPALAEHKGCCQKGTSTCGAPITVLGKKTCTLGWVKVTCSSKWKNCENGWMLSGPAFSSR
jgi:hypothetical protein